MESLLIALEIMTSFEGWGEAKWDKRERGTMGVEREIVTSGREKREKVKEDTHPHTHTHTYIYI